MCTGILKILLCLFNVLCLLVGGALITAPSVIFTELKGVRSFDNSPVNSTAFLFFIFLGCVIIFISILGCCGICKKSPCMLCTYALLLLAIFILQLLLGIYCAAAPAGEPVWEKFTHDVEDRFQFYKINEKDIRVIMDSWQFYLQCCGVTTPDNYIWFRRAEYPATCCGYKDKDKKCDKPYEIGCVFKLKDYTRDIEETTGIIFAFFSVVALIGAILAYCLRRSYKNEQKRNREAMAGGGAAAGGAAEAGKGK